MTDDGYSFTVKQRDGPSVTIHGAPREVNRIKGGIQRLFCRIRVARKSISWDELRRAGLECGILLDPRDDQPEPEPKYKPMSQIANQRGLEW